MFPFKKRKVQGGAEIHFTSGSETSSPVSNSKTWRSNESVTGYAIFTLPPGVNFSRSKIALKGVVTTRTEDPRQRGIQRVARTERYAFLAVALASSAWPDFEDDNGKVKIPFSFNVEESSRLSGTSELPPSIDSKTDGSRWSGLKANEAGLQYDITYSITASCYSERDPIASKVSRITVLPVADAQLPQYTSGEYFHAASKHGRRGVTARVQIAGQEPEPIRLDLSSSGSHGSTTVPFVLKLLPRDGLRLTDEAFPEQCEVSARLVTRTLITPNRSKRLPTVDEVVNDEDSFLKSFRNNEQTYTISLSEWQKYGDGPTDQFAITKFPFLFNIHDGHAMMPSFFTPILSRRYAIEIKLRFPDSQISNLELSVPLGVVYESDEVKLVRILTK